MKRGFLTGLLAASLALFTLGCGADKDSASAQLEKAMMAMDSGQYALAITYLDTLCPPPRTGCADEILSLVADAQMGLAGVELVNLIANLNAAAAGNSAAFNSIIALFGAGAIDATDVTNLADSLATLQAVATPTTSTQLQTAVAAAAHLVASVAVAADPDGDGVYNAGAVDQPLVDAVMSDLTVVVDSAAAVDTALGAGSNSSLTQDLNGLIADIEGPGGNGVIDVAELQAFVGLL
ncbi:MAG: hypothetical protein HZA24_10600 [Nitrospirae bacterium]|nr:hypothetical protein [Nitrospirota bacterium]